MSKLYVIAGEASGDLLGAHLMQALKEKKPDSRFYGVGGPRMAAHGLSSLFPYHELSLMGFVEIIPHMLKLAGRINLVVEDILAKRPDVVITIDSPGFCFRVVEKLRTAGCKAKFVHYVAPTVWMYKPERAARCAKLFDHMLVLLPFEPPYFKKEGLGCTFTGHPIVCETTPGNGAEFRKKYAISPQTKLFSILPGSRKGEIKRHMPILARTITLLAHQYPDMAIAVAVPRQALPSIAPYFQHCPFRAVVITEDEDKKNALAASDLAITKSGTIVLEIAQAGTPMIVTHRANPITAHMLRKQMLLSTVCLINILQEQCTPEILATAAAQLLSSPEQRNQQKTYSKNALSLLVPPGGKTPSQIAADTILQLL